jgi:hypothetical protein
MKVIALLILLTGCATTGKSDKAQSVSIKDELEQGNIDLQSVLDLGRSAYLKGCIDSKNYFMKDTVFSAYDACMELAKVYEDELMDILQ